MKLLNWMAAVVVAGSVAVAADAGLPDSDLLPWGERLSDYRSLTGEELRETITGSYITTDRTKSRARTPHVRGQAFCKNGRVLWITDRFHRENKMKGSPYTVNENRVCMHLRVTLCFEILINQKGEYLWSPIDRKGGPDPIISSHDSDQYCE